MAEEAAGPQDAAIEAIFSGEPAPEPGPEGPEAGLQEAQPDPNADDTWREGYVPKAFRNAEGAFTGDTDAVFKSWMDGRQRISQLEQQIAHSQREAAAQLPPTADEYVASMDWAELESKAPNAYAGGEADNPVVVNLLKEAHAAGVPVSRAQAMVTRYLASLNEHVPEQKEEAVARAEAIAHLGPNGQQIAENVKGRVLALARRQAIPEPQMAVLGQMMLNGPALALLDRLTAFGRSNPPPGDSSITVLDQDKAKRDANKGLGVLNDAEWNRTKQERIARWRAAHPEHAA